MFCCSEIAWNAGFGDWLLVARYDQLAIHLVLPKVLAIQFWALSVECSDWILLFLPFIESEL